MPSGSERRFAVGVNGGGTRTQFVLIDNELAILARLTSSSTNFRNIGFEAAYHAVNAGINQVIAQAGLFTAQIAGIGLGLAGSGNVAAQRLFQQALENAFPGTVISFDNDAVAALVGGAGRAVGIIAVSGTGSIVVGVDERGARARAGGWGYHLDRGSGYAIGRGALAAIALAQDGLGPDTALTERILKRLGLSEPRDLVEWLYALDRRTEDIAALAEEAVELAGGDPVAAELIRNAAESLADSVRVVGKRLDFAEQAFPLLTSGSLFEHSALLRDLFLAAVRSVMPDIVVTTALYDAAVGAAIMAFQKLGLVLPQ